MALPSMDAISGAVNSNIGNIEKAIIEIIDGRNRETKRADAIRAAGGSLGKLNFSDTFLGKAGETDLLGNTSNVLGKISQLSGANFSMVGMTKKRYIVQFNPSSLSIRARGPGYLPVISYDDKGRQTEPTSQMVRIYITVQLIVDQSDPFKDFMEDKTNTSLSALGVNIAKGVLQEKGMKQTSVQQIVEGFVAALRNENTRIITFHWGEMNYSGILNTINAQYTMFDLQGQPVRATINLSLMNMYKADTPNALGPWAEAYKRAFSGDSFDTKNGFTQLSTNWLNLG